MTYTAEEKQKEADREVDLRIRVYARLVSEGRMSKSQAARQIDVMQEIVEDYRKLAEGERLL